MRIVRKILVTVLVLALSLGLASPALAQNPPFHDVSPDAWYAEAVAFVCAEGIMAGVGGGSFNPQGNVSRAEVTALLFRTHHGRSANASDARDNPFADVGNAWYAPYVTWAHANGIVNGTSAETFHPQGNVTRQEFAVMVLRYTMRMTDMLVHSPPRVEWEQFTDRDEIAEWAYGALRWITLLGIMRGTTETTINPTGTATRAEAATIMMRFVENTAPLVTLSSELELRIRERNLLWWQEYWGVQYGTTANVHIFFSAIYSNGLVVEAFPILVTDFPRVFRDTIGGYLFSFALYPEITLFFYHVDSSEMIRLDVAFERGLISQEELRSLWVLRGSLTEDMFQ